MGKHRSGTSTCIVEIKKKLSYYKHLPSTWPAFLRSYPFAVPDVLKHIQAVVNDGLQHLLVVFRALADLGQVGRDTWQHVLVVLGQAPKLALSTFDLLLDMDPDGR